MSDPRAASNAYIRDHWLQLAAMDWEGYQTKGQRWMSLQGHAGNDPMMGFRIRERKAAIQPAPCTHPPPPGPTLGAVLDGLPGLRVHQRTDQSRPTHPTPHPDDEWLVSFDIDYSAEGVRTLGWLERWVNTVDSLLTEPETVQLVARLPDPDHQVAWALREPKAWGSLIGRGVDPETIAWWLATMWPADDEVHGFSGGSRCRQ